MSELKELMEAAKRGELEKTKAILKRHPDWANRTDETGATALHYAAFGGHRSLVQALVQCGADINARDLQFGATPAGWAIEYLRELDGFLSIELEDLAFAIHRGDFAWVARFLKRFPALRSARDGEGRPFKQLAEESGNQEIMRLFD
jgi:ankyrin repeat protein